MSLEGKQILVGVGGGIAAFKAVELVRELGRRGARVRVASHVRCGIPCQTPEGTGTKG